MKWLTRLFRKLFVRKPPCKHDQNYVVHRWLAHDGTPMQSFHCSDCDLSDIGHVHADADDWEPLYLQVAKGKEFYKKKGLVVQVARNQLGVFDPPGRDM